MAFQIAVCLLFISPTKTDIPFKAMIKIIEKNIAESTIAEKSKLPQVHEKLCEMAFHVFNKAITKFTGCSFEFHSQNSGSIGGSLLYDDVNGKCYYYKVLDAIKEAEGLKRDANSISHVQHVHNIAYSILKLYNNKKTYTIVATYDELELLSINEFIDSYDKIYDTSKKLSDSPPPKKKFKKFSQVKSPQSKKERYDLIFNYLVSLASPDSNSDASKDIIELANGFRDHLRLQINKITKTNIDAADGSTISDNAFGDIVDDIGINSVSNGQNKSWMNILSTLGKKRQTFSVRQINTMMRAMKQYIVDSHDDVKTSAQYVSAFMKKVPGYETVSVPLLIKWYSIYSLGSIKNKWRPKRRQSVLVNYDFESAVWSKLIWIDLIQKIKPDGGITLSKNIRGNICVSYDIIRNAAKETKKELAFALDRRVQDLKFSNKWVKHFLNRNKFTKKRVNSRHRGKFPSDEEINKHLQEQRNKLFFVTTRYRNTSAIGEIIPKPSQIINYDETSWHMCIDLEYLYSPKGVGRTLAPQGGNDSRERITCIPTLVADGTLGPVMMIVHDSSSMGTPDQSSMTVLRKCQEYLSEHHGSDSDKWEKKVYITKLKKPQCKGKKKRMAVEMSDDSTPVNEDSDDTYMYKINYLRHKEKGHVICSQPKAYNDTLRQSLFIDVILRHMQRKDPENRLFVWADGLGTHKTEEVNSKYVSNVLNDYSYIQDPFITSASGASPRCVTNNLLPDIQVAYLPPNTTAYLQPCDLLLNYLIKAFGRQLRNELLYVNFQEWTKEMDALVQNGQYDCKENYFFEASKVDYKQRLFELIDFYDTELMNSLNKDGVNVTQNCFERCGLAPIQLDLGATSEYLQENYIKCHSCYYNKITISDSHKAVDVPIMPIKIDESNITSAEELQQLLAEQDDEDYIDSEIAFADHLSDIGDNFDKDSDDEESKQSSVYENNDESSDDEEDNTWNYYGNDDSLL